MFSRVILFVEESFFEAMVSVCSSTYKSMAAGGSYRNTQKQEQESNTNNAIISNIRDLRSGVPRTWDLNKVLSGDIFPCVEPNSVEFRTVWENYVRGMPEDPIAYIRKPIIIRVQNRQLWLQYVAQRRKVRRDCQAILGGDGGEIEKTLYHGCFEDVVSKICSTRFNRSFAGVQNGAAYGLGTYFTNSSHMASGYGKVSKRAGDRVCVIQAKVLTGLMFGGLHPPTVRALKSMNKHSTVNIPAKPSVFVTFHDASAYPEYVIDYIK
ncbi:protein mono-ADP-ribosyltransferase PARP12-like [Watersipora subatra]|uniref:protein mono-ADP-ribosyltransferase PARP12-like n=1 Tax=Watersipora subatra TaxID=2589382 RepID=UPI00355C635A